MELVLLTFNTRSTLYHRLSQLFIMHPKSFPYVIVVVLFGILFLDFGRAETAPENWATAISHDRGKEGGPKILQLEMVSEGDPLIGKFSLEYHGDKQAIASPFVIEGHQG